MEFKKNNNKKDGKGKRALLNSLHVFNAKR
jgi:hypothetical protein